MFKLQEKLFGGAGGKDETSLRGQEKGEHPVSIKGEEKTRAERKLPAGNKKGRIIKDWNSRGGTSYRDY